MSDKIRVDFTPEEADVVTLILYQAIRDSCGYSSTAPYDALNKISKAKENPLNGPTFPAVAGK